MRVCSVLTLVIEVLKNNILGFKIRRKVKWFCPADNFKQRAVYKSKKCLYAKTFENIYISNPEKPAAQWVALERAKRSRYLGTILLKNRA